MEIHNQNIIKHLLKVIVIVIIIEFKKEGEYSGNKKSKIGESNELGI